MTLREKIADWISGGALTRGRQLYDLALAAHFQLCNRVAIAEEDRDKLQARLDLIASMETPRCASIGKRMARVARGE